MSTPPRRRPLAAFGLLGALGVCAGWLPAATVSAQDVISGLETGAPTASIPVIDVTGPYEGRLICYVCEFQDDPNVLAFFRDTGEDTARLIVQLDALYRRHAAASAFKAVAMIVAGREAEAWLKNLSETERLRIPLVVFRKGPDDVAARLYALNPDVENTFLVTENRFVVANVAGIAPEEFGRVDAAVAEMLAAGAR